MLRALLVLDHLLHDGFEIFEGDLLFVIADVFEIEEAIDDSIHLIFGNLAVVVGVQLLKHLFKVLLRNDLAHGHGSH